MKNPLYFFSCLLLSSPHLANSQVFGKSPEEKCFDAQMKVWNTIPNQPLFVYRTGSSEKKGYGKIINDKKYLTMLEGNPDKSGKAQYEAEAWVRCMKR